MALTAGFPACQWPWYRQSTFSFLILNSILTMKYISIMLISILMLSTTFIPLTAQDLKADLLKINQQYEGKQLALGMQLRVFASYEAQKASQTFDGKYVKQGEKYYYKYSDFEMVHADSFSLLVNHEREIIMIQPAVKPTVPDFVATLDSLKRSHSRYYLSRKWQSSDLPLFV